MHTEVLRHLLHVLEVEAIEDDDSVELREVTWLEAARVQVPDRESTSEGSAPRTRIGRAPRSPDMRAGAVDCYPTAEVVRGQEGSERGFGRG